MALKSVRGTFSWGDEPLNPDTIKALRERFLSQATVSTFVAGVQATTLGNSFLLRNTPTTLLVFTNALLFTGIVYNVSAGFLSLIAATALIREEQQTALYHEVLTRSTPTQLHTVLSVSCDYESQPTIAKWLYSEAQYHHIVKASKQTSKDTDTEKIAEKGWQDLKLVPAQFFPAAEILGNRVLIWLTVGAVAGLCAIVGITCFFISIVCLTVDAQAIGVWITTAVVLAPVVIFLGFYVWKVRANRRERQTMLRNTTISIFNQMELEPSSQKEPAPGIVSISSQKEPEPRIVSISSQKEPEPRIVSISSQKELEPIVSISSQEELERGKLEPKMA